MKLENLKIGAIWDSRKATPEQRIALLGFDPHAGPKPHKNSTCFEIVAIDRENKVITVKST